MTPASRVAVLGATGHVGRCLTEALAADSRFEVVAVARDAARLDALVASLPAGTGCRRCLMPDFAGDSYDAVINCIGEGDPSALARDPGRVLSLTEHLDDLMSRYLEAHPVTRLVNFSSGATYGGEFAAPAREDTRACFNANDLEAADAYGVAKLASEVKHRVASEFMIVDLRLFGFFSRHIDLGRRYLMNDVVAAIMHGTTLLTGEADITRDYVDPGDLVRLVTAVLDSDPCNDVFDVYSASPVRKSELLSDFAERFGLKYEVDPGLDVSSATGAKLNYYSTNRRAAGLGYEPRHGSLDTLRQETEAILRELGRR